MSESRFILTLIALLLAFAGGGYLVDHWDKPVAQPETVAATGAGAEAPPAAAPSETRALEPPAAVTAEAETRVRKEFDTAAADAAAEAEAKAAAETKAGEPAASTASSRSLALQPELVKLDTALLSADTVSVIAGKAPMGTEVTLLGNGTPLGKATADESGAWTIVIEEPLAPGIYKLRLSAIASAGGAAVVRDAGEVTVEALVEEAVASAAPSTAEAGGNRTETTAGASVETAPQAALPASTEQAQVAPPVAEITVPAAVVEIAGVPPDLLARPDPAASEPPAAVGEATSVAAQPTAEAAETAASSPSQAEPAGEAAPAQVAENDDTLATQAGDVADRITSMFTDWLNATKEQAEEAAKTFSLASASYEPAAVGPGVVTLSGRGPAKARVQVSVDKQAIGATEIAESGRWLLEVTRLLQPGAHAVRAEILAADGTLIVGRDLTFQSSSPPVAVAVATAPVTAGESGNGSEASATIPLVVSSVSYEAMGPKQGRVTVSGRAEAGAAIAVAADGERIGSATATSQGTWELASDTWLDAGAHAIRAERLGDTGEVIERTLSEFVREPAAVEVASAAPDETVASQASQSEPQALPAKPQKRKARSIRKRTQLAAKVHQAGKRAKRPVVAEPRSSGYHIVNIVRGNRMSRVRVRAPGRKGRIMSFVVPRGPGWYRVRRGDSLWRIADRWYGDGKSYPVIAGFNATRVPVPDRVRPRQRLRVP
jgi:nucleoid-associated protein YgaU